VVGQDQVSDIALLKLDGKDFPYAVLGNSDKIIIGEWVVALGNPFGLFNMKNKPTPTIGIVSGVDLDFGVQEGGRVYQDMIQTDAAINTGNSGGPLVNILGEVIGINTFIFTSSQYSTGSIGIGFAIPINRAKNIVEELRKYGKIDRSFWTGLEVQNVNTLIAKYFNLKVTHGVIITDIDQDSPAQKAGLMIGDVIVEVNGRKVKSNNDIFRIIEEDFLKAGDMLTLKIVRGGETKMVSMRLGKTH
ncbi:MAG: S1C family serine protease, partial [Fidelibacterota bacterium]